MDMSRIADQGLVLLGCGKMGSAMLAGWLDHGLPAASVWVIDPHPSDWLKAQGVNLNTPLPEAPAVVLVAVKPQMMGDALPAIKALGGGRSLFVSVAAGTSIATFEKVLGAGTPIVTSENAASRRENALRCRGSRASAPPSIRNSTIACGDPEAGPATASSASTASIGSADSSAWFSATGIGSTGSACTAPIAA